MRVFSGLTLAGHQVPTLPLYHSSPLQDRGEENNMKKNSWVMIKAAYINESKGQAWKQR